MSGNFQLLFIATYYVISYTIYSNIVGIATGCLTCIFIYASQDHPWKIKFIVETLTPPLLLLFLAASVSALPSPLPIVTQHPPYTQVSHISKCPVQVRPSPLTKYQGSVQKETI